ncbi:MAG: large subunit ribosomal protein L35 [Sphingobacteriales bacterium]|jgi:large subunit ribosomal protein L35
MPKMKTNSSAKKRFKLSSSGKIRRKSAYKNHILTKKSKVQKKRLTKMTVVAPSDEGNIKRLLTIGK